MKSSFLTGFSGFVLFVCEPLATCCILFLYYLSSTLWYVQVILSELCNSIIRGYTLYKFKVYV